MAVMPSRRAFRTYGSKPHRVAVLHGGPGAAGEVAPVARELSVAVGVIEPFQAASSVEGQIAELADILNAEAEPPAVLIGWSWGAMLALMFAAEYPTLVSKLILISSGVYEESYAAGITTTRTARMTAEQRSRYAELTEALDASTDVDKDGIFRQIGELLEQVDSYDELPHEPEALQCSYSIHEKVWSEVERLRREGRLIEYARRIRCPVVAIHGDYDPHPAEGIRQPLSKAVPNFRFILLERCGHTPWFERQEREVFFDVLKSELPI